MDYTSNRKQEVLTLARKIEANKDMYPEVMQTVASCYLAMNTERRKDIANLWKHKEIRKLYRESGGYSKLLKDRRKAGNAVRFTYPRSDNDFHKAKNSMYDKGNWCGISVVEFLSMNTLLNYSDIKNIHKYFQCVNAQMYDSSLTSVGFLQVIRHSIVIEILTFKLLLH